MQTEHIIDRMKEILLWIYIMAILAGTVYAACMGQETTSPGEAIYSRTLSSSSK